jgi:hypothetical protein
MASSFGTPGVTGLFAIGRFVAAESIFAGVAWDVSALAAGRLSGPATTSTI